jgi:UDP-N-acetylglucosamine 4-epimerase
LTGLPRGGADPLARAGEALRASPLRWAVTGVAGFIGSALLEWLLEHGQTVAGIDDFSTGKPSNLRAALDASSSGAGTFRLVEGSILDPGACREAVRGADVVLHQAAEVSVPGSLDDPVRNTEVNVLGTVAVLAAARDAGARRVVYASSSAVYGDSGHARNSEADAPRPLSPYGVSKHVDELYARVFGSAFAAETAGLRYFNVFGPRQDPNGHYAAVIPRWTAALLAGEPCRIFGDGESTRDFVPIRDVVQANVLAATAPAAALAGGGVFNVARGEGTSLNVLFGVIRDALAVHVPGLAARTPVYEPPRPGDIRHSVADVERIRSALGFAPSPGLEGPLGETVAWYAAAGTAPRPG